MKTCLIVIYNNNYESNIEKVEKLHQGKFSKIYHLMPFYTGTKENVIKVYGNSYQFQGYINYGLNTFINDEYTHYCFVGDDVVLSPHLNENNFTQYLNLDDDSGFVPGLEPVNYDLLMTWRWAYPSYYALIHSQNACEYQRFIPSISQAQQCFEKHNLPSKNITSEGFSFLQDYFSKNPNNFYDYIFSSADKDIIKEHLSKNRGEQDLYPLVASYSDFFVIPHKKIREFTHLCSIFESIRIFAEVAIPTAMVLTLDRIVTAKSINKHAAIFTDPIKAEEFAIKSNYSIKALYSLWEDVGLLAHPIKLSKWNLDNE